MTKITYIPKDNSIEITGHAGFAPSGQDIVCAAVSILTMTLENMVFDHAESLRPMIYRRDGDCRISCNPGKGNAKTCNTIYETIYGGFELLALHYPKHVQVKKTKGE